MQVLLDWRKTSSVCARVGAKLKSVQKEATNSVDKHTVVIYKQGELAEEPLQRSRCPQNPQPEQGSSTVSTGNDRTDP